MPVRFSSRYRPVRAVVTVITDITSTTRTKMALGFRPVLASEAFALDVLILPATRGSPT